MDNYSRPLDTNKVVEDFLKLSLKFDYTKDPKLKGIIPRIVDGELGISKIMQSQTLSMHDMRDAKYRTEDERCNLRKQIIQELFTKKRLLNDERITIKKGGALPICSIKSNKQAYILIGLPASGKSGIATKIAEDSGAIIIDSDFAKRKLPEFHSHLYGASIVHQESSNITFGFQIENPQSIESLYELCIKNMYNVIIPRIGQNPKSIIELASALKQNKGYDVHLILVSLPKRDATIRAVYRYANTKRYVPLGLIFDGYGNDPSHCYYYLRSKHTQLFNTFGVVSTENKQPEYTDAIGDSPVLHYEFKDIILQLP